MGQRPSAGIRGIGTYMPPDVVTAEDLARESGIPADVLRSKFGVHQVYRAGPDCHVSQMATAAAQNALEDAVVAPIDVDVVLYCGSEWKDYLVWSAAAHIAHSLGCNRAEAFEIYALCAAMPIALRVARDMMLVEPDIKTMLLVSASKESALVNRSNARTRFMINFGDGAAAVVLQRDFARNTVLASSSLLDGSLSEEAIVPAGGSRRPASIATVTGQDHFLDVPRLEHMRERLDAVSLDNFVAVIHEALARSHRDRIDFLAPVHMKRSMHDALCTSLNVDRSVYLENHGHIQAADQLVGLHEARRTGLLRDGDTVVLAAAGVGYTWAATVVSWGTQANAA
ncbi:MAG: ketoacyl-ACP synthase III [Chloroflexota bacterium]